MWRKSMSDTETLQRDLLRFQLNEEEHKHLATKADLWKMAAGIIIAQSSIMLAMIKIFVK